MQKEENNKKTPNIKAVDFGFSYNNYAINEKTLNILPAQSTDYTDGSLKRPVPPSGAFPLQPGVADTCSMCGEKMDAHIICELEEYNVYNCTKCGSILFDPAISRDYIDNFYSELQPETIHSTNHAKIIEKLRNTFTKIFPKTKGKSFLNVGAAQGYAVEAAKPLNFATIKGIDRYDFHTSFQKENYGEKFFETSSIEEYVAEGREPADVVVSIENLCQQPNVDSYIEHLAKVTKPGGTLYIEEVDGNSYFLPTDLSRWDYMLPPITCNFISKEALYKLLNKHGFKVKKKLLNWGFIMKIVAVRAKQ